MVEGIGRRQEYGGREKKREVRRQKRKDERRETDEMEDLKDWVCFIAPLPLR